MREPDWDWHCAEFAAAHVKAEIGRDIWEEAGGCPRSPKEAAAFYRKLGTRTLKGAVTNLFGKPRDPKLAMRGDLVLVMSGQIAALGICRGELIECADRMLPIGCAVCAWQLRGKP